MSEPRAARAAGAAAWAAVAVGAVLRVAQYLSGRSLWADESFLALNILNRSFVALAEPLEHNQAAPYGFLALTKLAVTLFGQSEYALRLVPLAAGLASLVLVLLVARRVLRPWLVPVAVASFAVCDQLIYYASEVKQYSTDVAVTLAIVLLALHLLERPLTVRVAALAALAGAAAVWLAHPAIFVLAACGLALVRRPARPRDLLPLAGIGAAWLASFGLFYFLSLEGMAENRKRQRFWGDAFMPMPPWTAEWAGWMKATTLQLFANPGGFDPIWLAIALFAVGCVYAAWRDWRRAAILLGPILLCLAASALRKYPFSSRLLLFVVPLLILLAVKGIEALAERTGRAGPVLAAAAAVGLLLLPAVSAARHLIHPRTREEIKPVLAWVRDNRQPGDVVYLYYGAQYPMQYYATRYGFAPGDYTSGKISRRNPERYLRDLDALAGNPRVWIVFSHPTTKRGLDEERYFLDHLDRLGTRVDELRVDGASGYLYDLTTDSRG
jgi:hypothetical protein